MRLPKIVVTGLCCLVARGAFADVTLPAIIGTNMVVQRDMPVRVWGWAAPGERVTVKMGSAAGVEAVASADGKWAVTLPALPAGPAPDMTVAGTNTLTLTNILAGDVWVCSGQSNMQLGAGKADDGPEVITDANQPQIRLFYVPQACQPAPSDTLAPAPKSIPLAGSWQVCTPDTLAKDGNWMGFSAVGYRFGRDIHDFTHAPVGLIGSYWGGTAAQCWTSLEGLKAVPALQPRAAKAEALRKDFAALEQTYQTVTLPQWPARLAQWRKDNQAALDAAAPVLHDWEDKFKEAQTRHESLPPRPPVIKEPSAPSDPAVTPQETLLFNGMIAPLLPYRIKGVIWYQGEANVGHPAEYRTLFPAMIRDWRNHWGEGDFPFLFVQLANYTHRVDAPEESDAAALREAQAMTLSLPATAMAVTIDIGVPDIHPMDKYDVGHRLALAAEHLAYGAKPAAAGPRYSSMQIEGAKVRLTFDTPGNALMIGGPPPHFHAPAAPADASPPHLVGFAVAGADHHFAWADATITDQGVNVSSAQVPAPVAVRYAWGSNPACNLYNKDGFPAVPFRTDDWPVGEEPRSPAKPPVKP